VPVVSCWLFLAYLLPDAVFIVLSLLTGGRNVRVRIFLSCGRVVCSTTKIIFPGWVKVVRAVKL
jgi:hypothetical protein